MCNEVQCTCSLGQLPGCRGLYVRSVDMSPWSLVFTSGYVVEVASYR